MNIDFSVPPDFMPKWQFCQVARFRSQSHNERLGQSLYNILAQEDPNLANMVMGQSFDPYYNDDNIKEFLTRLYGE